MRSYPARSCWRPTPRNAAAVVPVEFAIRQRAVHRVPGLVAFLVARFVAREEFLFQDLHDVICALVWVDRAECRDIAVIKSQVHATTAHVPSSLLLAKRAADVHQDLPEHV